SLLMLFLGCRVARLGLGVHGVKPRQGRAIVHLIDDPGFHPLLLRPLGQDMIERACGISTTPSWSATMTSFGNTATPPQPIGSPQPTKVSPATDGGAAKPSHHTGRCVPSTPSRSRTTPSVTSAATPRLAMRAQRMSPKMPAS